MCPGPRAGSGLPRGGRGTAARRRPRRRPSGAFALAMVGKAREPVRAEPGFAREIRGRRAKTGIGARKPGLARENRDWRGGFPSANSRAEDRLRGGGGTGMRNGGRTEVLRTSEKWSGCGWCVSDDVMMMVNGLGYWRVICGISMGSNLFSVAASIVWRAGS